MKKTCILFTIFISIGTSFGSLTITDVTDEENSKSYQGQEIQSITKFVPRITQKEFDYAIKTTPLMLNRGQFKLTKENVEKSKFLGTNFWGSSFTFCSLEGASFDLVNFENAKLTGSHGYFFRTIGSNLTNAALTGCNFHYGDFYGVIAIKAKFEQGKFISCRFQNADLTNASFQGSNLKNTLFIDCLLEGADFSNIKGKYQVLPSKK